MKKVVLSVAMAMTIMGVGLSGGVAHAAPAPGKDACRTSPGYAALGYANQGQCVKAANDANRAGEPFPPETGGGGGPAL